MIWVEGADYSYSHPDPAGFYAAGKRFALRYFSHSGKGLTASERDSLWSAHLVLGGLYETTSQRALDGHAAGVADGQAARSIARGLDYPDDLPIFYAVDFNAGTALLNGPVGDYLRGVASVDPHAGVYGGIRTVAWVFDHAVMAWGFQTYAWSAGVWDARAQIQQYHNGQQVAGGDVDLCRAHDDYPFWTSSGSGEVPVATPVDLTPAAITAIGAADDVKNWRGDAATNPTMQRKSALYYGPVDVLAAVAALSAKVDALAEQLLGKPPTTVAGDFDVTGTLHLSTPPPAG